VSSSKKAALRLVEPEGSSSEQNSGEFSNGRMSAPRGSKERSQELIQLIKTELDDDKAEDILVIDLAGKSDVADAMVIASGRSQRHVNALAEKVSQRLKEAGVEKVKSEGQPACDWVLIDAGDIIVHLFRPEVREFYNLERIWSESAHAPAHSPTKSDA
jgi:ribosome-associated protein